MTVVRLPSESRYAPEIGFSAAVAAGDWVVTAGSTAVDGAGRLVGTDAYQQTREALRKIGLALAAAGAALDQVVQTRMYITSAEHWPDVGRAHGEVFAGIRPAASMLVVAGLLDPRMLVEIEAIAYLGTGRQGANPDRAT